jgi:hypothetical protein
VRARGMERAPACRRTRSCTVFSGIKWITSSHSWNPTARIFTKCAEAPSLARGTDACKTRSGEAVSGIHAQIATERGASAPPADSAAASAVSTAATTAGGGGGGARRRRAGCFRVLPRGVCAGQQGPGRFCGRISGRTTRRCIPRRRSRTRRPSSQGPHPRRFLGRHRVLDSAVV